MALPKMSTTASKSFGSRCSAKLDFSSLAGVSGADFSAIAELGLHRLDTDSLAGNLLLLLTVFTFTMERLK